MAQATLVGQEIDDGQKVLAHLAAAHIDVSAAAWIKSEDGFQWQFYIASKAVEEMGRPEASMKIGAAIRQLQDLWVEWDNVRIIGATDPIARDLIAYQSKHPKRIPLRFPGYRLGALDVEEAFIYPPPAFLASQGAPAANANTP
jgi:hypothetical protein